MNKTILIATVALTVGMAGGVAQAHAADQVRWSVTVGQPAGQPVYLTERVYVRAAPPPATPARHYGRPTRWDVDGDGIPNRYDRVYNPVWDRDGDGIPNRYDQHPRWPAHGWQR